jgi:hypothetical protein
MIKDNLANKTGGEQFVECLIVAGETRVWVPAMGMNLYSIGSDGVPRIVQEVKIRDLKKNL